MIKWIGQHIFDLISRFRTTVYLENLETSTETNILVVDSDGKVTKNADAGDDMSFTVEDGDTTDVVISDGKHWKFVEGGNININWTDTDNGTSSDEYDLTFTGATLQELLISASHNIRGVAGSDVTIASAQDIKFHIDYDQSETAGTHTFDFVNGTGSVVASIDESGVPTFSIGAKGSASSAVLVDGGSGAIKSRTLAEFKGDASLGNVEDKSSATIRGEIVDGNIPALATSKITSGTFDDARIPSLAASKVTSGTFDAARIPTLNQSTTGQAGTVATIAGLAPNTATTAAAQPNITSLGTLTAGLSIGGASYTGDGVSVTGSPSDNTYDVFVGKRKFPRITLIDDAASGDTAFQIWNLGDELRIGTSAGSHGTAALVIHAGNAALVEVQDDLLVNDDLTVSGQIELGHASDTTIARSAAGTVTIEGETVITAATLGYHGSATRIKILPKDFMPDDSGRPVMIEDDTIPNSIFLFSNSSANMYAYVDIPTGFKATHVKIEGSDTSQHFSVYEGSIDAKTITQRGADTDIGTEADIQDVTSSTTNYLVIRVESNGTSDQIFGGYVTIAAV